jgi:hypothetical protein
MTRLFLIAVCTAAGLVCAGCDEKLSSITGPTPDLAPTFTSIRQNIFAAPDSSGRVACTGCHSSVGRTPSAGLDLASATAHAQLVNVPSNGKPGATRVIPGDPENSYIIHKLEGRSDIVGLRMPRGTAGPFLTAGQIRVIKRWIELGALDN